MLFRNYLIQILLSYKVLILILFSTTNTIDISQHERGMSIKRNQIFK